MSWGEVKYALNSTLGTSDFLSLDKLIPYYIARSETVTFEYETPGTYRIPVPSWAKSVSVTACGGGGGGGGSNSSSGSSPGGGGGGGGAAIISSRYPLSTNSLTITVGSGGTASKSKSGTDGNPTTIQELNITLNGGKGGEYPPGTSTSSTGYGGASGGAGGGSGGNGGNRNSAATNGNDGITGMGGNAVNPDNNYNGGGGGGSLGSGGRGGYTTSEPYNYYGAGKGIRGGGGGGAATSSSNPAGGGDGYCKITFLP